MPNVVANYFDLNRAIQGDNYLIPQYTALVVGIIAQPLLVKVQETHTLAWSAITDIWGWLIVSVFVGLVIFPGVYRNSFDPQKPIFVQLCNRKSTRLNSSHT